LLPFSLISFHRPEMLHSQFALVLCTCSTSRVVCMEGLVLPPSVGDSHCSFLFFDGGALEGQGTQPHPSRANHVPGLPAWHCAKAVHTSHFILHSTILPILQMTELRHTEIKCLIQGHRTTEQPEVDLEKPTCYFLCSNSCLQL
jgi:hypothetical protein